MFATILFQLLCVGGMALLGWWLCVDDDAPQPTPELRQETIMRIRRGRSAA